MRLCLHCSDPLPESKRPHAKYCSRNCKAEASKKRTGYYRRRYASNPLPAKLRASAASSKRRALIYGADHKRFTRHDWERVKRRAGYSCFYCGSEGDLQQDHVVPLSRGGRHAEGNIVPSCPDCNVRKGSKLIAEWRK